MKCTEYNSKKISSILKCVKTIDGKQILTKNLKGFLYAECKPHDAACIVNVIAIKGSEVRLPQLSQELDKNLEEYISSIHRRRLKVSNIKVHSVVLLPTVSMIPRTFLEFEHGEVTADFKPFYGKNIEYAHSQKGDLYIANTLKFCQLKYGFSFYFNASDVILTSLQRP